MKKLLCIILIIFITLALVACVENDTTPNLQDMLEQPPQNSIEIDSLVNDSSTELDSTSSENVGDIINFGEIDWRVLDVQGDRTLIISQEILELRGFHDTRESITWEHSDIRQYLNYEFIYNRFTDAERSRIAQTTIINHCNPWFGTDAGNDTIDRIFLLSLEELARYFGDSGQLANRLYDWQWGVDDEYNNARVAYTAPDVVFTGEWSNLPPGASFAWWLRSPGAINVDLVGDNIPGPSYGHVGMTYVLGGSEFGLVDIKGVYITKIIGIRPALWLNP